MTQPQLPVTIELAQVYIQQFDQNQLVIEQALSKLFRAYPYNLALDEVLLKVGALNSFRSYAVDRFVGSNEWC